MNKFKQQLIEATDLVSSKEYEKALSILLPLVEKEVPGAIGILGAMYQLGEGVPHDVPKAVELLTQAYKLGDGVSAHNLGTIYGMGQHGVERDYAKSKFYYCEAKKLGAQFAPDDFYE